jgi:hypothetical protein
MAQATPEDLRAFALAKAQQDAADINAGRPVEDALRGSTTPNSAVTPWAHVVKSNPAQR